MKITRYIFLLILTGSLTGVSAQSTTISGVINHYTTVLSFDSCKNAFQVDDAGNFQPGDTIVIIQMKGAVIDSSNSSNFGDIINYRGAGNYEFNYVSKKNGNELILKNRLLSTYNIPDGSVQLVRVPYYKTNVVVNMTLTAAPWDGSKGGVLVLNTAGNILLNAPIDVSGKGFRGGIGRNRRFNVKTCDVTIYAGPYSRAAQKGESIVSISENLNYGRGAPASGGGGGLDHNSGGGGGGNGGIGGFGGYQYYHCTTGIFDNRGFGGRSMDYSSASKVFMGGGGGAGDANNDPGPEPYGGNGGGIAIIIGNNLTSNNFEIASKGGDANECALNAQQNNCHDGMGGGGAGGSILLNISNYADPSTFDITGGKGADMRGPESGQLGPGGGGGGGIVWFSEIFQPTNAIVTQSGGQGGINVFHSNDEWGATGGDPGRNYFSLELPFSNTPFTANIESIGFNQTNQSCSSIEFEGFAQTNVSGITSWNWNFGDGIQQSGQKVTHTYSTGGDFIVSLFVTDQFGCSDTSVTTVKSGSISLSAGNDVSVCANTPFTLVGSGASEYSWSPGIVLNDSTYANPVGSIQQTTRFTLIARDGLCEDTAYVVVTLRDPQRIIPPENVTGCEGSTVQLKGNNGNNVLYEWSPASLISDPSIANPIATVNGNTSYTVKITEPLCNTSQQFPVTLTILPKPNVQAQKSNDVDCAHANATLMATGADRYTWTPATNLNNPSIPNPTAIVNTTTLFTVTGTTTAGCTASDTIRVIKGTGIGANFVMPNAFTPNNDRNNDCFGVQRFGDIVLEEFSVFNRWGQKVFSTKNPLHCWDGYFQGKLQETGGYGYIIRGKSSCGPIDLKGVVLLIR